MPELRGSSLPGVGRLRQRARWSPGHAIARSAEPGEDWSRCFGDEIAFVVLVAVRSELA